jgi:hypothetical protein
VFSEIASVQGLIDDAVVVATLFAIPIGVYATFWASRRVLGLVRGWFS